MEMKCSKDGAAGSTTVGDTLLSRITINLQDYFANGPLLSATVEEDPTTHVKRLQTNYGKLKNRPIEIGAIIQSLIKSTTANSHIGAGPELRIDQNAFRPESISYTIVNNKYKLGAISDKDITGHYMNGTLSIPGITFLTAKELQQWQSKLTPLAGGQTASFSVTVEAQVSGTLTGGTKQKTNSVRFIVEVVVNGGIVTQSSNAVMPTPLCASTGP